MEKGVFFHQDPSIIPLKIGENVKKQNNKKQTSQNLVMSKWKEIPASAPSSRPAKNWMGLLVALDKGVS